MDLTGKFGKPPTLGSKGEEKPKTLFDNDPVVQEAIRLMNDITANILPKHKWHAYGTRSEPQLRLVGEDGKYENGILPINLYQAFRLGMRRSGIHHHNDSSLDDRTGMFLLDLPVTDVQNTRRFSLYAVDNDYLKKNADLIKKNLGLAFSLQQPASSPPTPKT